MGVNKIEIKNIEVYYNDYPVIEDFSLDIVEGEIVAFFGPSGCGKSTLLKAVLGQVILNKGVVLLEGLPSDKYTKTIAYTPQDNQLLPWLTVEENVTLWSEESLKNRQSIPYSVAHALEVVELTRHKLKLPAHLSGGMARRAALARALATHADIFALDEVFVSVEKRIRKKLMVSIRNHVKERKITTLLISHDYEEAVFMADRIVVLSPGAGDIRKIVRVQLPEHRDENIFDSDVFKTSSMELIV